MIFLTIGSDTPFSRLVKQFDTWCKGHPGHEAFAQIADIGPSDYVPTSVEWIKKLPADEFSKVFSEADMIIAHAGMGSILSALSAGKPIVVMPRRGHLGETRNDHQYATSQRF